MSKKQITRNCHWVPQAYLRAFAATPDKKKIWRFSKNARDPELKNIDKVAVRFHLYVPKDKDGKRDNGFEEKLSSLENWFGDPLWCSAQEDMVDLSDKNIRKLLSLLVAVMYLRNPNHLDFIEQTHAQFVQFYSRLQEFPSSFIINDQEFQFDHSNWPEYRDSTEDDLKRMWIEQMNDAAHIAQLLMNMRWSMIFSEEPVFVTTDNPVVFLHPSLRFRGINNPETLIMFPISPTRILHMDHLHHEPANQYYPLRGSAAPQNLLMWRSAIEHMFSHRHTDEVCNEFVKAEKEGGFGQI